MEQIFGGGILWTLLIGFLAGLLARALKPGDDKLGFFMTIVLGVLGALLARFIGGALFLTGMFIMFYNMVKTIAGQKAYDAPVLSPAAAHA